MLLNELSCHTDSNILVQCQCWYAMLSLAYLCRGSLIPVQFLHLFPGLARFDYVMQDLEVEIYNNGGSDLYACKCVNVFESFQLVQNNNHSKVKSYLYARS